MTPYSTAATINSVVTVGGRQTERGSPRRSDGAVPESDE
jgi:hypothetical protein